MNREQFKKEFKETLDTMYGIMEKKNADYAKTDPFGNFNLVESLGITSVEKGILVRMADKMSRISNLIDQEAQVKDEAIEDTLQDLANYAIILKLYLTSIKTIIGMDLGSPDGDSVTYSTTDGDTIKVLDQKRFPEEAKKVLEECHYFFISERAEPDFKYDGKRFETYKQLEKYIVTKFKNDRSN